ncbi:protein translocase subunit SecF [Radicibacter daui]|uniref:protein translocase subunit SecF n=1 Tax=Radicibacter daui TaxID=3064829 RepID=UPI004046E0EC
MRPIRWIPDNTRFNFIGWRHITFAISFLIVVVSFGSLATRGLNFGIDFEGGTLMEVKTSGPADMADMRGKLDSLGLGEVSLQQFGAPDEVMIRIKKQEGDEAAQAAAINAVKQSLGDGIEYRRTEFVGPQVGDQLKHDGILAVTLAVLGIMAYVWFRFEWQYAVAAIVALLHDCVAVLGLFSLTQMEFNLTTVAAVLTVAGYSINDTVVVFDRTRDDLRKYRKKRLDILINDANNQMLARSIMTSMTVILTLLCLLVFGGDVLRGFSVAMTVGVLVGTYSSIFVATALLLYMPPRRTPEGATDKSAEKATAGDA